MIRKLAAVALMAASSHTAHAAQATGNLSVEANVLNTCIVTTMPVVFSDVGLAQATAMGSITVNCTNHNSFSVALDGGGSNDISERELAHTTAPTSFTYQLYTDGTYGTVWGNGTLGETVSRNGPSQTLTVYGRTTGTPDTAGSYSDLVRVTVTY